MAPKTEDKKGSSASTAKTAAKSTSKPTKPSTSTSKTASGKGKNSDGSSKVVGKANAAAKAALRGVNSHKVTKVRTTTSFYRPKTLKLARKPKYPRKSIHHEPRMDEHRVIIQPLNTENVMKNMEYNNTLVLIVNIRANKRQIKSSIKKFYGIDCMKINTLIRPDGTKKAFIRLSPDVDALDVAATKLSLI